MAAPRTPPTRAAIAIALTVAMTVGAVLVLGAKAYDWVKAVHVIAVISWMAGMLYLPRLFIYHCDAETGSKQSETFKLMEQRLLTVIINPAMGLTWALGLWLAWQGGWHKAGWFHAKLLLVIALSAAHGYFSMAVRRFAADSNAVSARHWRMINEIPTILMIAIVVLVIVKPF